jgi:hypothetical protein
MRNIRVHVSLQEVPKTFFAKIVFEPFLIKTYMHIYFCPQIKIRNQNACIARC